MVQTASNVQLDLLAVRYVLLQYYRYDVCLMVIAHDFFYIFYVLLTARLHRLCNENQLYALNR
jgi:hypothetical protein